MSPPESRVDPFVAPVATAVRVLRAGGVIGLPTETVYGLAADAENDAAVARIFAIKGRPAGHPLIVHLADARQLADWSSHVSDDASALAERFWPGPLTLVVPRNARASDRITGGVETVALRVPAHPIAHAVLEAFGGGLAAPSANRYGRVSPTTAQHVRDDLGTEVGLVLDGGAATVGIESTIVDVSGAQPLLLRLGAITEHDLCAALSIAAIARRTDGTVRAPGTTARHYAPRARVVLVDAADTAHALAACGAAGERATLLAFGDAATFARELYGALRAADDAGFDAIVVAKPRDEGFDAAVLDRLTRAAFRGA